MTTQRNSLVKFRPVENGRRAGILTVFALAGFGSRAGAAGERLKSALTIWLLLSLSSVLGAQEKADRPEDLGQAVEQWMKENLDERVLEALNQIDQERVRAFFEELQRRFGASSIYDLASLKETASRLLPVLQTFEETRPYAVWLETHIDYFEASDQMRREVRPAKTNAPPVLPRPSIQLQRTVWNRQLLKRPSPPLARAWLPRLKEIFLAERVPPALAWVAEVESSFNPAARSPAGAAGLFQLMPATARSLNLSSWPRDERLEPEKNARAAAQYLRSLYRHYGDWRLALGAYNAGESRVDRLLKKYKATTFDAIAYQLPAETQMYVPKVEATLLKREGLALSDLKLPKG